MYSPDEHKVTVNSSTVHLEEAWTRREGKARFGQPIQTPALAEDVKGDLNASFSRAFAHDSHLKDKHIFVSI